MAFARELIRSSRLCNLNGFTKLTNSSRLNNFPFFISVRNSSKKHYNPKFRWLRSKKFIDVTLPFTDKYKKEVEYTYKTLGLYPRYWRRRQLTITSAGEVFEPYEPPDGDGKVTTLSNKGVIEKVKSTSKNVIAEKTALRKIKNYDSNFERTVFLQEAHDIYVKAHTVLMKLDPDELYKYATEDAVQNMLEGLKNTTVRWEFIESLEPPKLVQARAQELISDKNTFAQLTVRFHTKQKLAIYDRFGRLMCGSEILAKDVLEYVVFEKHISNEYGVWRILAKIIPEWRKPIASPFSTYRIPQETEEEEEDEDEGFSAADFPVYEEQSQKTTAEIVQAESKG